MPVVNGDVVRAVVQMVHQDMGSRSQNVYHWQANQIVDGQDSAVIVDIVSRVNEMYAEIAALFDDNTAQDGVKIVNATQRLRIYDDSWDFTPPGGEQQNMPAQVATLVLARTAIIGKTGRKYLGPFTENAYDDGALEAAATINIENFVEVYVNQFVDPVSGNEWNSGVARYVNNQVAGFEPFVSTNTQIINVARTMRSRTPGRGLT